MTFIRQLFPLFPFFSRHYSQPLIGIFFASFLSGLLIFFWCHRASSYPPSVISNRRVKYFECVLHPVRLLLRFPVDRQWKTRTRSSLTRGESYLFFSLLHPPPPPTLSFSTAASVGHLDVRQQNNNAVFSSKLLLFFLKSKKRKDN